jgi:hypothetical protein
MDMRGYPTAGYPRGKMFKEITDLLFAIHDYNHSNDNRKL